MSPPGPCHHDEHGRGVCRNEARSQRAGRPLGAMINTVRLARGSSFRTRAALRNARCLQWHLYTPESKNFGHADIGSIAQNRSRRLARRAGSATNTMRASDTKHCVVSIARQRVSLYVPVFFMRRSSMGISSNAWLRSATRLQRRPTKSARTSNAQDQRNRPVVASRYGTTSSTLLVDAAATSTATASAPPPSTLYRSMRLPASASRSPMYSSSALYSARCASSTSR